MKSKHVRALIQGSGYNLDNYSPSRTNILVPIELRVDNGQEIIVDERYCYGKMNSQGAITLFYDVDRQRHASDVLLQIARVLNLRTVFDENNVPYDEIPPRDEASKEMRRTVREQLNLFAKEVGEAKK